MPDATVSAADYAFIAAFLRARCAVVLDPGKEYLILSRLSPLSRKLGLPSVEALIARLRENGDSPLADDVVEAMVTTETSFFRDVHLFDVLRRNVLPDLIERRRNQGRLSIWSAACSSGQEPYSIALLLKDEFPELRDWRIRLLATDVSREMIRRGESALYSQMEVNRGLPDRLRTKWFQREGDAWKVDPRIRDMVSFSRMNLAQAWPTMPRWDLALVRNVLIYFDVAEKKAILRKVAGTLADDGYLALGSAETTLNLDDAFVRDETARAGLFRLRS